MNTQLKFLYGFIFAHFYTFFTLRLCFFSGSFPAFPYSRHNIKTHLWRWIVSVGVICGALLVLLLLGYLVYALLNAEDF
ncbi:K(+)-transporting ATPase subunit F [Rahnella variigena]|uniref:K(+)-transporting ATPase subunit F n=1 Tax=Rahnella variigena TaxID=574964 RepID=A0ABX9PVH8_9GAMM|nr:K(+)-transporting ATPase subunit F [Rahnella variigena]